MSHRPMPVATTTEKPTVVVVRKLEWSEFSPAEVRTEIVGVFPDRPAAAFVVNRAVTHPEPGWVKVTALHMENGSLRRSYTITEYEVQDNLPERRQAAAEEAVVSHDFLYDVTDRGPWRQDGDDPISTRSGLSAGTSVRMDNAPVAAGLVCTQCGTNLSPSRTMIVSM